MDGLESWPRSQNIYCILAKTILSFIQVWKYLLWGLQRCQVPYYPTCEVVDAIDNSLEVPITGTNLHVFVPWNTSPVRRLAVWLIIN